jgi:hypothetical protein
MPTALPISYPAETVDRTIFSDAQRSVWLILSWAIVMLLFGAVANFGVEPGPVDPFQLLGNF